MGRRVRPLPQNFMDFEDSFWAKVPGVLKKDECWIWTGARTGGRPTDKYGCLAIKDGEKWRTVGAHRFSKAVAMGRDIKPDLHALHTCDNKLCVNPNHLVEGTEKENAGQAAASGLLGLRRRKLTTADVADIRELRKTGASLTEISVLKNVSVSHLSRISSGERWA